MQRLTLPILDKDALKTHYKGYILLNCGHCVKLVLFWGDILMTVSL